MAGLLSEGKIEGIKILLRSDLCVICRQLFLSETDVIHALAFKTFRLRCM